MRVTDARGLVTQYARNGLGDLLSLVSPDTGTSQFTVDAAGNVLTRTDARGITLTRRHDALGRLVEGSQAGGPTRTFAYDQGPAARGRLSSFADGAALTEWRYHADGRLAAQVQTLHGRTLALAFAYAPGGRLARLTYPSGRVLDIGYDAAGRPASLTLDGTPLLAQASHEPFGPPRAWLWGDGASPSTARPRCACPTRPTAWSSPTRFASC